MQIFWMLTGTYVLRQWIDADTLFDNILFDSNNGVINSGILNEFDTPLVFAKFASGDRSFGIYFEE